MDISIQLAHIKHLIEPEQKAEYGENKSPDTDFLHPTGCFPSGNKDCDEKQRDDVSLLLIPKRYP